MSKLHELFPTKEADINRIMSVVLKYINNEELYQLIIEASDIFRHESSAEVDKIFAGKRYKEGQNLIETLLTYYSGESATWLLTGLAAGLNLAAKEPQITRELR